MENILDKYRKDPIRKDVLSFLTSINEDIWILEEDVLGTIGHVVMLSEQKILDDQTVREILTILIEILDQIKDGKFKVDQNFEDIHPYIESIIIKKIGIEKGGKIHSARSRNDQVAVDIRLKIRKELLKTMLNLNNFVIVLLEAAKKNLDNYCPLYTHLQRGQLGLFSHYLLSYSSQIQRQIDKMFDNFKDINCNPLGACAIGGTSFPINRERTAELLGFDGIVINSIDAISSRDHIIYTIMIITLVADIFTRICEDFIIWASAEFNFIDLDDGYSSVSSAMPQKKNPDSLELIKGRMSRIYGSLNQILYMSKGTPSGYVRDFQESKVSVAEAFKVINEATIIISGAINTMKVRKEPMLKCIDDGLILSLDLAELISLSTSLSFREAHNLVGALIKKYNDKRIFNKVNIEKMAFDIFEKKIEITQSDLDYIQKPQNALEKRKSLGAPNKNENIRMIELFENKAKRHADLIQGLKRKLDEAEKSLISTAKKIIK